MEYLQLFSETVSHQSMELFARAGGGGSGGGGSGGGGSGGNIIAAIGYIPAYYTAKFCNNRGYSRMTGVAISSAVALCVAFAAFMFNGVIGFIVFVGAFIGVAAGMNDLHARIMQKVKQSRQKVQLSASTDPVWQESAIIARVGQVYTDFQNDWSHFNTAHMQTYLSSHYVWHVYYMMKALSTMKRQNVLTNVQLLDAKIVDAHDDLYDTHDTFTAYIKGQATDSLVNTETNSTIYTDTTPFSELWRFVRSGDSWMLDGISQLTENINMADNSLKTFAESNGMYYSLDWGWLLLPQKGKLFGRANFKRSDVNNHVIGEWEGLLVQLYTYLPYKAKASYANYLVGQITLPKSYGGIVIQRKRRFNLFDFTPSRYTTVRLEWPEFNKRYTVYATDMDRVTSFELLQPAFMAELYDINLPIYIEVVDNVVYFYTSSSKLFSKQDYENMMLVLRRAHKELKR